VKVTQRLAGLLDGLEHPGASGWIDSQLLNTEDLNPADAQAWLTSTVQATARDLEHWITQAKTQLKILGLAVPPAEVQAAAMRLASVGTRIAERHRQVAAGEIAPPLVFPNPPAPMTGTRLQDCLQRWETLRQPTSKTVLDAKARLAELADLVGSDRLGDLEPSHISTWKSELLASKTISTVKRRLGLIRAVLSTAHADGLGANPGVLERLNTSTLGGKGGGVTVERKHFSNDQAKHLITRSRGINSPHTLDRWAFPLGLSLGCRLEELAGLRHQDVCQIDGFWVVIIEPHQDRRLKNSGSARNIPIPDALIAEGFIDWAQAQPDGLLFPDRKPPQSDPRLGHYASKRLGTILRTTMAIADPSLVFHSCRHFVGQALTDAGAEQRAIESIQGHASRGMTARYSKGGIPLHLLAAAQATRDWSWWPRAT
jgi:integrase